MKRSARLPIRFPPDIVIRSDTAEVCRIQQRVVDHLLTHHFAEPDIFGIRLALEEALINAVKHGNRLDRRKQVRIAFCIRDNIFYVRIGDEGCGFDPAVVPDPTDQKHLELPSGRGLMLMRHYMHGVRFLGNGNTVVMWKRRASESRPRAPRSML